MAPTRPLKHAQTECARTVPVPNYIRQGSVENRSGFSRREELTDTLVLNLKGNSTRLPSSTDVKKGGGRDSVIPTLKKALLNFKHGNDGHTIWALRAIPKIMHCLNTQDLWNIMDKLGEGAKNSMGAKTDYVRAACLEMMVVLHGEIAKKTVEEGKLNGKNVLAAESGDIVRKAIPSADAKAIEHAVVEEAEERRDRILFEGRMAEAIITILEDESNHPELRGAAERAVYEIDSPLLREMIVKDIEDVQRHTGLMWEDTTQQKELNRDRARELILIAYLADIEAESAKFA